MVGLKSIELKESDDFKSDFESKKSKLDSKDEANLSFYECPTAAASIQGFGEDNRYNSNSLDSEQDFNYYDGLGKTESLQFSNNSDSFNFSDLGTNCSDGGSVSTSQFTKAKGGYFAGYQAVLFEGTPTLKKGPEKFLDENSLKLSDNNINYLQENKPELNYLQMKRDFNNTGVGTPFASEIKMDNNFVSFTPNFTFAQTPTFEASYSGQSNKQETVIPFTVTSVRSEASNMNDFMKTGASPVGMSPNVTFVNAALLPSIAEGSVSEAGSSVTGKGSTLSYVQEGFETIAVPKYRPVEVVERTVEVPVVHHIDTFVPKKEIQEVESYVKKPYTKYVDKVVEVPQVHYTDKIVEVPEYHEITKTVPRVEVQEKTNYVPKVEVKVVPKYVEVPVVKIVDKYEEYEQVEEVVKHVEKVEVVEVPKEVVKTVVKPVRKIVEKEKIVPVYEHRDVPVEKIRYVPKVETVEHLREVPKVVDVPVPYSVPKHQFVDQPYVVPKYRDVPVAVPVAKTVKPVYEDKGPTNYVDVPVHKPYFVIHDHLNFKPVNTFATNTNANPFQAPNLNTTFVNTSFNVNPTTFAPNQPNWNPGFSNNFVPNSNNSKHFVPNNDFKAFNSGTEYKDYQEVSYKVVGMNKVDLDKMAPEEKKKAQDKLNEALANPDFEVYKKSLEGNFNSKPNTVETNFNFANANAATAQFNNWTNVPNANFNGAPGFNGLNAGNFSGFSNVNTDNKGNTNHQNNHNATVNDYQSANNATAHQNSQSGLTANFGNSFNRSSSNLGSSWSRWSQNPLNNNPYPNSAGGFQGSLSNNFGNKYKYDGNYSTSLSNWTDRLFKFFTGSKSPASANSNLAFNAANSNQHSGHVSANKTDSYPNAKNPFDGLNTPSSKNNFWSRPSYNLLQESFRNWKVPNMNLDLERNTPTNKMFFQETENPYAKSPTDQYYMSSGSGSVGHRAEKFPDKSQVYPSSEVNSPTA
ncbi:membrane skeletal protein IMC1 [Theileria orientalis strain Shintoku]|uniref:Membrane skeletal protein IMC1 n=1 Tax=Theileria orientalis strain Shintoku TaxID=869250 RepID=J4D7W2_THEOR|nr:membrane skeletal protein IMC1 [Theileria orientalis strain Shintoku]PVC50977.1 membrane skeletal protein IMC1 [Theileria orientalis]BAM40405.1 membrane skeletal protein IMC1 [Theileria orientalis strain Shintoku]|eukprot:XP_009690706.1 membrane skeletal protein IMC1 [Theileria orientalis strain Shintoku]